MDLSPRKMAEAMAAYREQEAAWVADVEAAAQAKEDAALLEQVTGDRGVTSSQGDATKEEMARVRQDLETQKEIRDFWSKAPQAAWQVASQQAELEAAFKRDFADLRTPADVDRLLQTDPQRATYLRQLGTALQTTQQQLVNIAQGVTQADRMQFDRFAGQEDAKFLKSRPEFGDPKRAPELQRSVLNMLAELGYTTEDVAKLWQNDRTFRSARAQEILADAAAFRAARANFKAGGAPKDVRPLQRPGMRATDGALPAGPRVGDVARLTKAMERATGGSKDQIMAAIARHRAQVGR